MKKFDVNKVTPRGDISWYIKWASSMFIISAMVMASADMYPYNLFLQFVGLVGWFIVGMLWHDRALIFLNAVLSSVLLTGIIKELFACSNCMIPL